MPESIRQSELVTFFVSFNHRKYGSSAKETCIAVTAEGISASVRGAIVITILTLLISIWNCARKLICYGESCAEEG